MVSCLSFKVANLLKGDKDATKREKPEVLISSARNLIPVSVSSWYSLAWCCCIECFAGDDFGRKEKESDEEPEQGLTSSSSPRPSCSTLQHECRPPTFTTSSRSYSL